MTKYYGVTFTVKGKRKIALTKGGGDYKVFKTKKAAKKFIKKVVKPRPKLKRPRVVNAASWLNRR